MFCHLQFWHWQIEHLPYLDDLCTVLVQELTTGTFLRQYFIEMVGLFAYFQGFAPVTRLSAPFPAFFPGKGWFGNRLCIAVGRWRFVAVAAVLVQAFCQLSLIQRQVRNLPLQVIDLLLLFEYQIVAGGYVAW